MDSISTNGSKSRRNHLEELDLLGYTLVEGALPSSSLEPVRSKIDRLFELDLQEFGQTRLQELRELGTLRFPMVRDRYFLELLSHPAILEIIEALLGPSCILHLQNCIVLVPEKRHQQSAYHQDFRPYLNGADVSFNAFVLVDDFTDENGGTYVVPGTHRLARRPSEEFLERHVRRITGPAGSVLFFDSRLWHRGGENHTTERRRAVNHQYTAAFIRQQVDYAHCLPEEEYATLPERTQQLLGRFVRLPRTSAEFRVEPERRLHRAGQF